MLAGAATVWLLDMSGLDQHTLARWRERLGASERARLSRFRRVLRGRQFVAARMLLRHALAGQTGGPVNITVTERPGLAPLLTSGGASPPEAALPYFSLSHSGCWVACAVSADVAVGVDVEIPDAARDTVALATQAFSAVDAAAVVALEGARRRSAFYQLWCRYEARYKLGAGHGPSHLYRVPHAVVEIALCSARPLATPPSLLIVTPACLS